MILRRLTFGIDGFLKTAESAASVDPVVLDRNRLLLAAVN